MIGCSSRFDTVCLTCKKIIFDNEKTNLDNNNCNGCGHLGQCINYKLWRR